MPVSEQCPGQCPGQCPRQCPGQCPGHCPGLCPRTVSLYMVAIYIYDCSMHGSSHSIQLVINVDNNALMHPSAVGVL